MSRYANFACMDCKVYFFLGKAMSEHVTLYSSHLITFEELNTAILAAGGGAVELTSDHFTLLGRVEDAERHVLVSGDRDPKDDPESFWAENMRYLGLEVLEEIQTKLGGRPVISFYMEIGHAPKSGLLAVELAYQCATRWSCVVWAEVYEVGNWMIKVYTREDMERLRAEGQAFTDYGMDEDEED